MPDTIYLQHVIIDSLSLDTITHKLEMLQNGVSKITSSTTIAIWISFVAAVVGGVLVWIGQAIERNTRKKTEMKNSSLEVYAYCRKLEAEMRNNYRELAMAKVHVAYWWHAHQGGGIYMQKYYEEHLRSQAFAREVEKNIGNTKAAYIGHVRKFQALIPLDDSIDKQLETISELTNEKAKDYDISISHEKVRHELVEPDEKELREIYYKNLITFKIVNDKLQKLLKAL
ncbi:MAG: hypothetical protein ABI480_12850 [Chitinophagaceae bacterium]